MSHPVRSRRRRQLSSRLARLRPTTAITNHALLHVGLKHAKGLFMPLNRHVQRLEHALRGVVVDDNPLLDVDRLGRHTERLLVQSEVENKLFGRTRDAAEVCIKRNRVLVSHFHTMLLLRGLSGLALIAIRMFGSSFLIGHSDSRLKACGLCSVYDLLCPASLDVTVCPLLNHPA